MSSFDPSPLDDDRPVPPSSAVHAEYWGAAATLRPHLTAAGPRAVLDYWETLRGPRRFPARAGFDPMAVRKYLPNIFMLEATDDGGWRYRVVGSIVSDFFGVGNPAGKTPEDIFGANAEGALGPLRICSGQRAPYMHTASASWIYQDRNYVYYEVVVLPLGESDDKVDKVLCCAEFVSAEEAARA
ncbi:MAG: PAS domain-containing protein [Parvibaculum sp.]|uniref:PAS domain-containing protein n=1 Tax=Parvibaculum sp. TaxID=2024848 RepID=UPI002720F878|nr:PAS domain-containing protein [Parvibaculum sp.]MDO8837967.1 PAS domain-containing protein [Parvibaculum sp.]